MSNIEINDFSTEFYEDFREDAGYLADSINRTMSDMARRYGYTFNAIKAWRACK